MRARTWSPQNPIEGPRQRLHAGDSHSPPLTTTPTAPARVPGVEHAGTGPDPRLSPQERGGVGPLQGPLRVRADAPALTRV